MLFRSDVLADDGTVWLNLGDSYSNAGTRQGDKDSAVTDGTNDHRRFGCGYIPRVPGLKNKDLIGIPWRVAFAFQADGWYLRQDIIWHKPNPMPESVRDRCTKAHEYIFLLAKSEKYFCDMDAVKEPAAQPERKRADRFGGNKHDGSTTMHSDGSIFTGSDTRNRRSVWTVTTKPYKGAHFATFPPDLIEPCILAGSRAGDTVLDPFMGSGTTAAVAVKHGRKYLGCELNPNYAELQQARIAEIAVERREKEFAEKQMELL